MKNYNREPTKIKWEKKNGKTVRISKRTNEEIAKPEKTNPLYPSSNILFFHFYFWDQTLKLCFLAGSRDTAVIDAIEVTYKTPSFVAEILKLEKELREMKLINTPKTEETQEPTKE